MRRLCQMTGDSAVYFHCRCGRDGMTGCYQRRGGPRCKVDTDNDVYDCVFLTVNWSTPAVNASRCET